jgi:hypothetical protein
MDKVNVIPRQAMKADGGVQMKRHSFLTSTMDGCNREINVSAVLPQGKHIRYPYSRRLGGFQSLLGLVDTRNI